MENMEKQEYKVRVEHLTKYFGNLHVLDDVSFNIKRASSCVWSGQPAAGKQPS